LTDQASFPALGSTAVVVSTEREALDDATAAVRETVDAFDQACSRFREDSELTTLNRAGGRTLAVGPILLEAVAAAVRAAELTDGDVDPTLGQALIALGYDRDFELGLDDRGSTATGASGSVAFAAVPGWRTIRVDPRAGTVGLGAGVTLDLGATAKALACDHAAAAAGDAAGCGVLVSLGGDIATAGPAPTGGWRIRVTDDHRAGVQAPGQWITIHSGGLATSSTTARRWRSGGESVHHLLDPRTGRPSRGGWRTVSVAAATCLDANIATTAAIVRGRRAAPWLRELELPARLVTDDGRAVHIAGWPEDGDDLPTETLDMAPGPGTTVIPGAAEVPA
jgi:thiamine biosynthesis lipoprotein